jgi:hypothetical protein
MSNHQKRPLAASVDVTGSRSLGDIVGNLLWMLTVADPDRKHAFCNYFKEHMPRINGKRRRIDLEHYGRIVDVDRVREAIDMIANIEQYFIDNNLQRR